MLVTLDLLRRAVAIGVQDDSSDFDLNPHVAPQDRELRDASVLIPVVERDGLQVILTKRASHLKHHPGQIAFPGGKVEAGETPLVAALREAEEEIGLSGSVDIFGPLNTHETVTNFNVMPFVGLVDPFDPVLNAGEVEEVFKVPLDFLMAPENMSIQGRNWRGQRREYYTIPYGPYYIWGATARMIKGLSDRVLLCK